MKFVEFVVTDTERHFICLYASGNRLSSQLNTVPQFTTPIFAHGHNCVMFVTLTALLDGELYSENMLKIILPRFLLMFM